MEITSRSENKIKIIELNGQLDSSCVGNFRDSVLAEVNDDRLVLLDCEGLTYLDSSGLATLLNLHKNLVAREASMVLSGLSEGILRVIRFTKLDRVLHITDTVEEGIQALSAT